MSHVCIVINDGKTIAELNELQGSDYRDVALKLSRLLRELASGFEDGSVQLTVRDSDPAVATSGAGSTQVTYTK